MKSHYFIIIAFSFVCMIPAFLWGAGGVDLHTHSLWTRYFNAQLWQGNLYPRWLMDMFAGHGSPVFFYYPPLSYFMTAMFVGLGKLDAYGYVMITASSMLAFIISGITFYWWMKDENTNPIAALIGSVLYIVMPNHLAQDFYHSLLFTTVWAYAWLPLLMLYAKRIRLKESWGISGFAFALFLLLMTSLPMTVMFGPLAIAYGLLYAERKNLAGIIYRLGMASVLALGLSAIYLLPALSYTGFANINAPWNSLTHVFFFHFSNINRISYIAYWLASFAFAYIYWKHSQSRMLNFFMVASLISLVLMLPWTLPLWNILPPLRILQMSERLFAVTSLSLAAMAVFAFPRLRAFSITLIGAFAFVAFVVAWNTRVTPDTFDTIDPMVGYEQYALNIEEYATYLTTPDLIDRYFSKAGIEDIKKHNGQAELVTGDADVKVLQWQPRHIMLLYKASKSSVLRIRQFDFPGWQAFTRATELEIMREPHTGEMLLNIPHGEGEITLTLAPLLPEIAGRLITIMSMGLLLVVLLLEYRRKGSVLHTNNA